ncbi:MAG TPA: ABC transporter permease subunit [Clostridia bacterium]|nr:ABC transporter permease subunit [Clostridia bacterium]
MTKMKKNFKLINNVLYPLIALGILFLAWVVAAKIVNTELIIPSVRSTFETLFALLGQKAFYTAVGGTLFRTIVSFLIAFAAALVLAVLSAFLPVLRKILSPAVTVARAIPTMSLILLTIIWLNPSTSPLLVGFFIVFPLLYDSFYTAIAGVDPDLVEMSKAYKVSKKDMVFSLYLPNIAPAFFDSIRSTLSFNVKIIISAEVLAQTRKSMGIMMQISKSRLETADLLAWTLAAIVLSYLLEIVIYAIKTAVVRWQK